MAAGFDRWRGHRLPAWRRVMARKSAPGKATTGPLAGPRPPAGEVPVFVSWSGDRSRMLAEALRDWLRKVMPDVDLWVSSQDIKAGLQWGRELDGALGSRNVGILCLTRENLAAPWIMYEAGCLARSVDDDRRVIPYLLGVPRTEVTAPLSQFQMADADQEGTRSLVKSINAV